MPFHQGHKSAINGAESLTMAVLFVVWPDHAMEEFVIGWMPLGEKVPNIIGRQHFDAKFVMSLCGMCSSVIVQILYLRGLWLAGYKVL